MFPAAIQHGSMTTRPLRRVSFSQRIPNLSCASRTHGRLTFPMPGYGGKPWRKAVEKAVSPEQIQQGIQELAPWFYPFDFGDGLKTVSAVPPEVTAIFDTRLRMVEQAVKAYFGERLPECLDIGCHEGFYSLAMARLGMKVTGIDAREENLRRARFVAEGLGVQVEYKL